MARNGMHEIEFGGGIIKVPAWATEEQLEILNKISADSLKEIEKIRALDRGILTAVTKMMSDNERLKSKETKENEQILKTIEGLNKTIQDTSDKENSEEKKNTDRLVGAFTQKEQKEREAKQARERAELELKRNLNKGVENFRDASKGLLKGISKGDFEGMATAVGAFFGLGAAAGVAAGVISEFGKGLSVLADSGAGFGMSLMSLRQMSTQTGMEIGELGKLASGNSLAFRALGENVNEGFMNFASLSRGLRTLTTSTLDANGARLIETKRLSQYGLSNQAFNEILAEEIDLRRRAGMTQQQITDRLNNSFRDLIRETTLLAGVTGVDRRQILQARQTQADNPAARRFLADNQSLNAVFGTFANVQGEIGNEIISAIVANAATGGNVQMAQFGNVMDSLAMIGPQTQSAFLDLNNYIQQNQEQANLDPEGFGRVFTATIQQRLGEIYSNVDEADIRRLEQMRFALQSSGQDTSQVDSALEMLSGISVYQGTTVQGQVEALARQAENLERRSVMDLESATKNLGLGMKEGIMRDFVNISGIDIGDDMAGDRMVALFDEMGTEFAELGFLKGMYEQLSKLDATSLAILAALTGGSFLGPAIIGGIAGAVGAGLTGAAKLAGRGILGAGKSLLRFATGGLLFSGGAKVAGEVGETVVEQGAKTVVREGAGEVGEAVLRETGETIAERIAKATASAIGTGIAKKIPLAGLGVGAVLGGYRAFQGDFVGAGMEVASGGASMLPVVGTGASIAIDAAILARDIAAIYRDAYPDMTEDQINAMAATTASTEMLAELSDRIARSESGEDVYWGRENVGQMEDRRAINDLLVSEIVRLNAIKERDGALSDTDASALENLQSQLMEFERNKDNQSRVDPYERLQRQELEVEMRESPELALLVDRSDEIRNKLFGNNAVTDLAQRADLLEQYGQIRNELEEFQEGGMFGTQGDTPQWVENAISEANRVRESLADEKENLIQGQEDILEQAGARNIQMLQTMVDTERNAFIEAGGDPEQFSSTLGDLLDAFNQAKERVERINHDLDNVDFAALAAEKSRLIDELDGLMFNSAGDYIDIDTLEGAQRERVDAIHSRLEAIGAQIDPLIGNVEINTAGTHERRQNQLPEGPPSLPSNTLLQMHRSTVNKLQNDQLELAALEEEYGKAMQIGINEKKAKALLRSGIADNEEQANEMAAIYGYEDDSITERYNELNSNIRDGQRRVGELERDQRYKSARARELATEMGIEDVMNLEFTTQGNTVSNINGQAVPTELLTDRELENLAVARQMSEQFNNRPVSSNSQVIQANEPPEQENNNRISETILPSNSQQQLEAILNETNRLLRKQTDIIEQGQ